MVVLSYARYCRYRSLQRRIEGNKKDLFRCSFVQDALVELGIPLQRNCRVNILFCRDSFDHEELVNHDLNCDHLGNYLLAISSNCSNACYFLILFLVPRLKGRIRKKGGSKSLTRASSPESISSEDNSQAVQPRRSRRAVAVSGLVSCAINYSESFVRKNPRRNKQKKNLKKANAACGETKSKELKSAIKKRHTTSKLKPAEPQISSSGNETDSGSSVDTNNNLTADTPTPNNPNQELKLKVQDESVFLEELNKFMKERKTPIQRLPNLGFKKSMPSHTNTHLDNF